MKRIENDEHVTRREETHTNRFFPRACLLPLHVPISIHVAKHSALSLSSVASWITFLAVMAHVPQYLICRASAKRPRATSRSNAEHLFWLPSSLDGRPFLAYLPFSSCFMSCFSCLSLFSTLCLFSCCCSSTFFCQT